VWSLSGFAKNIEASANEERRTQLNRKKINIINFRKQRKKVFCSYVAKNKIVTKRFTLLHADRYACRLCFLAMM